jgi:hypothetical protein
MWEDKQYCWVVICKNTWFHLRQNIFFGHRIPLGETDVYEDPPDLKSSFKVQCDVCQKEYFYAPSDVMKSELELPESFSPHALFRPNDVMPSAEMKEQVAVVQVRSEERRRSQRGLRKVEVLVRGESVEKEVFQEKTFTISVSSYGALVVMSTKVVPGQTIVLKNLRNQDEIGGRVTRFAPTDGKLAQVSVEFMERAPKFWRGEPAQDTYFPNG